MLKVLFFPSVEILALKWYSSTKNLKIGSEKPAIFEWKVSTAYELSFSRCFQIMGSFISLVERYDQLDSILFYRFGICMFYYAHFVKVEQLLFFLNSKLLYNRSTLPSLKTSTRRWPLWSIWRWRCMLKSNRDSNYCLRDHVNHRSKFCFDINGTNSSTLISLMSCSPKSHHAPSYTLKAKFQFMLWIACWRAKPLLKNKC